MSGIFNTLNTASKGMNAQQTALHTTGHNIANANTKGYSRQRVDMKADISYSMPGVGQLGTGVKMETVTRMIDDYVSRQINQENNTLSQFSTKSETLGQLEIIYNEPSDTGLNFNIGEMFESWQELAKNPENLSSKTIVVEKSNTFADTFNHINKQLETLKVETDSLIKKELTDVNATINSIDTLNKQIFNIAIKGHVPNDLLDQRDVLLNNLSSAIDTTATFDKYGRVALNMGDEELLSHSGDIVSEFSFDGDINLNSAIVEISKGSIKGYVEAKEIISEQIVELVEFGNNIVNEFNEAHRINPGVENETNGYDFFKLDDGKIKVNDEIVGNNELVLSGFNYSSPPGDGSRALTMATLRTKDVSFSTGLTTIENKYNTMITRVGISKQHADNMVSNQDVLLGQLQARKESTSGVSIDEEVTNMVKFQRAFEANARVISTLTEMLDVLINRTGV